MDAEPKGSELSPLAPSEAEMLHFPNNIALPEAMQSTAFSFEYSDMPTALGHDGRIQKLTMRTPPNNENENSLGPQHKTTKIFIQNISFHGLHQNVIKIFIKS